jgi:hypothetical protein
MNECCPPNGGTTPAATVTPPVEWCAGNRVLRFDSGRIIEAPISNPIPDGVYANATIRTVGGCIVELTEGTNVVYSACDPCVVPPTPPTTADVTISGEACNLTTLDTNGALLTRAFILPTSSCVAVSGCGTALAPFQIGLTISPDAGNAVQCRNNGLYVSDTPASGGVNFVGCGIVIQNGLVTSLPLPFQPLLNLTSSDGSITLFRSVDGCSFDMVAGAGVPNVNLGGFGAQLANTALLLNNPPQNGQTMGVVGTVNPREFWIFIQGVGWREVLDSTAASLQINV